ncbi:MAG: 2-oxoacid:acceptor oxidoreductase family protein [Candidatus Heimdallarchaeota archaeon]|nr:2-oxoacid:acceptor oxidoreductase family protein [Candidatus Heimdallarchaeota archaeon]MDH5645880.1 2-oxoacid:acceptor oxidoreductase family protein [Candidatus Heimdallarchaeota archaeon]
MNLKIKIAGIGGQGVQFFGKLLGEAAFKQGLNVSQGVIYEPSTTGGLTVADITLAHADEEIIFPYIEEPNILIVFAQRCWDDYKHLVTENTILLVDQSNVQDFNPNESRLSLHLPFSKIALDIGSESVMNVVALGFISEMLDISDNHVHTILKNLSPEDAMVLELLEVAPENFEESLIKSSPKKFQEMNLKAFKMGYNLSLKEDYSKSEVLN